MKPVFLNEIDYHSYFIIEDRVYEKLTTYTDKDGKVTITCISSMYYLNDKWYISTGSVHYHFSPTTEVTPCTYAPLVDNKPYTPKKKLEKWQIEYYRETFLTDSKLDWSDEAIEAYYGEKGRLHIGSSTNVFESAAALNFKKGWDAAKKMYKVL